MDMDMGLERVGPIPSEIQQQKPLEMIFKKRADKLFHLNRHEIVVDCKATDFFFS
jgi:hypothetical protein